MTNFVFLMANYDPYNQHARLPDWLIIHTKAIKDLEAPLSYQLIIEDLIKFDQLLGHPKNNVSIMLVLVYDRYNVKIYRTESHFYLEKEGPML